MPKVLRIINRFNIGGPTYNATFLTRFISDEFETLLIGGVPDEGETDSLHILEEYGVQPIIIDELQRNPNFQSDRKAYKKIKEIIREFKPDIVHTHAAKAGALGRRAAYKCKVPVIVHTFHGHVFHSYFGKAKTTLFKKIERNLAKKSTGIIAISEQQKHELSEIHNICSADKIKIIPLGFDLDKFRVNNEENRIAIRAKYTIQPHEVAIAIVGRLAPIKDHDFFLNVIERIMREEKLPIRVFIVGDGSEAGAIRERVNAINTNFPELITMTSWITNIGEFNSGMDIIALTSKNEGTPVSLIEAQAGGLPVISTDVGGVKDIVANEKTGFIVPVNDLELYAEKLKKLITDQKLREKMSQNGWDHVREQFHYTRLVKNMEDYYRELLEKR
ncbi:glycosyltransferase family 4 protein [Wandonia haliotis]|uniref:Glycosyltransferase family 4 protein n=1 Tax=Wandonia haliotis TaxID=574963 RepID=A0ABP3XYR5_9FLAO